MTIEYKIEFQDKSNEYVNCTSGSVGNNKPIKRVLVIKEDNGRTYITENKHWLYTNPKAKELK